MGRLCYPTTASGQGPGTLARKLSRCKEGMARVFASPGTNFIEHYACRGTSLIEAGKLSRLQNVCWGHWRSVAVQVCLGARKLSRYRIYIAGRCACPDASIHYRICLGCRSKSKNRDKQLTHIVRVSWCFVILKLIRSLCNQNRSM